MRAGHPGDAAERFEGERAAGRFFHRAADYQHTVAAEQYGVFVTESIQHRKRLLDGLQRDRSVVDGDARGGHAIRAGVKAGEERVERHVVDRAEQGTRRVGVNDCVNVRPTFVGLGMEIDL